MDELKNASNLLEEFFDSNWFNKSEIKVLEEFWGRKIDFAYPGWVAFKKEDNSTEYCGSFGEKSTELMLSLVEKRIAKVRELADKIDACQTDEEVMEICCKIMMDYAQSWKDRETHTYESEHRKRTLTSIEKIEVVKGRHVYESNCKPYSAINVGGKGIVVVRKYDDKYEISRRVVLCGECRGCVDSMHIQKELIDFMRFIS